jgi:uncharacterized repeat protein (TIGR03803 family)
MAVLGRNDLSVVAPSLVRYDLPKPDGAEYTTLDVCTLPRENLMLWLCRTICLIAFMIVLLSPVYAAGPTVTTLYSFGPPPSGFDLQGTLVIGKNGTLYGTSYLGGTYGEAPPGSNGYGTVFSLTPPQSPGGAWTETTLWNFGGTATDGQMPAAGVVIGPNGVLYGTTSRGGAHLNGTVFSLSPPQSPGGPWTETVLHSFGKDGDGLQPFGNLVMDSHGVLYGTTISGGLYEEGCVGAFYCGGTVLSLTPPTFRGGAWTEAVLWSFGGFQGDGLSPTSLAIDSNGVLYGTTESGGAYYEPPGGACPRAQGSFLNCEGTVFSLTPPATQGGSWTETLLWSFGGSASAGSWPNGVIVGNGGVLYGTTQYGSRLGVLGTVFSLTPPSSPNGAWTERDIHGFTYKEPMRQGDLPVSNVVMTLGGALFGTTLGGGDASSGTIYALKPPAAAGGAWAFTTVWNLEPGSSGQLPMAALVRGDNGVLYGTTSGSELETVGSVFSLVP